MSFARVAVFVLALTHVVGLADLVLEDACEETCDDEDCSTDCIPGLACRCHCPSAVPLLGSSPQTIAKLAPTQSTVPFSIDERIHESPDPREILHVPKRAV